MPSALHEVVIGELEVVKRFRSPSAADREWQALSLLDRYGPGLAPEPLRRSSDHARHVVVMSRLPGGSLGGRPLSDAQTRAVASALNDLHRAVPEPALNGLPRRRWNAAELLDDLRARVVARPEGIGDDVHRALAAGAEWVGSADASRLGAGGAAPVLAHADGNLANFLWDGRRCRVVDFEDAGVSDRAFEAADVAEHVSGQLAGVLDGDALLAHIGLDAAEVERAHQARRLMALYWLIMLLPGNAAHRRNPPGSVDRQSGRLLQLLS